MKKNVSKSKDAFLKHTQLVNVLLKLSAQCVKNLKLFFQISELKRQPNSPAGHPSNPQSATRSTSNLSWHRPPQLPPRTTFQKHRHPKQRQPYRRQQRRRQRQLVGRQLRELADRNVGSRPPSRSPTATTGPTVSSIPTPSSSKIWQTKLNERFKFLVFINLNYILGEAG
jgi:hypothetical protein